MSSPSASQWPKARPEQPPDQRIRGQASLAALPPTEVEGKPAWGYLQGEATTSSIMDMQTGTARPRRKPMAWLYLIAAGVLEVVWSYSMKQSEGFSRPGASVVTVIAMIASVWLLAAAMRTLPLGTSYMVWTGIGAVGTFVVGIAVLGEAVSIVRIAAACLIVAGLVLMKLSAND
jgi:quaternary ammonium compound-resistance protein SugE